MHLNKFFTQRCIKLAKNNSKDSHKRSQKFPQKYLAAQLFSTLKQHAGPIDAGNTTFLKSYFTILFYYIFKHLNAVLV